LRTTCGNLKTTGNHHHSKTPKELPSHPHMLLRVVTPRKRKRTHVKFRGQGKRMVRMPYDEFVKEHKHLMDVLSKGDRKSLRGRVYQSKGRVGSAWQDVRWVWWVVGLKKLVLPQQLGFLPPKLKHQILGEVINPPHSPHSPHSLLYSRIGKK